MEVRASILQFSERKVRGGQKNSAYYHAFDLEGILLYNVGQQSILWWNETKWNVHYNSVARIYLIRVHVPTRVGNKGFVGYTCNDAFCTNFNYFTGIQQKTTQTWSLSKTAEQDIPSLTLECVSCAARAGYIILLESQQLVS